MADCTNQMLSNKATIQCNSERLLKVMGTKGKLTIKSILDSLKYYVKQIDSLTHENELIKIQLKEERTVKTSGSTEVQYLQGQVDNLLKELMYHRQIEDDRKKMKIQMDKMAHVIKQLMKNNDGSIPRDRLIAGESDVINAEKERLKDLLNKMTGIEGKILDFKQKAAYAKQNQDEVDKLRFAIREERIKGYKRARKMSYQCRKQLNAMKSQLKMCSKERDIYINMYKKLEGKAKKAISERNMYLKRLEDLESKYDRVLVELEKAKTRNTEFLMKENVDETAYIHQLRQTLQICRSQRDHVIKRNKRCEKRLRHALRIIHRCGYSKLNMMKVKDEGTTGPNSLEASSHQRLSSKKHDSPKPLFRYWRKVSKKSNLLLKIMPELPPPVGLRTAFVISTEIHENEFQQTLMPSEDEIHQAIAKKNEAEKLVEAMKVEAKNLVNEIRQVL